MVRCKNLHLEPLLDPITAAAENLTHFILAFVLVLSQVFLGQEKLLYKSDHLKRFFLPPELLD